MWGTWKDGSRNGASLCDGDCMWGTWREGSRNGASLCEGTECGGPGGRAPLVGTPEDMLKGYIKRDVKMPCKQVSFSIGALLGNLEGIRLPGLFGRKG